MDASTRPPQHNSQGRMRIAAALAALFLQATLAQTATDTQEIESNKNQMTTSGSSELAFAPVHSGEESIELSARYSEQSTSLVDSVYWKVSSPDGSVVFEKSTSVASLSAQPGDYKIEVRYGTAVFEQKITVQQGMKLNLNFVLNAGALRVLPRVKGIDDSGIERSSKIFALSGISKGQLIATSFVPGEIIKLSAGDYRIESKFKNGNAVAVTDVRVKPGKVSAANIDHLAGLANFSFLGAANSIVHWEIKSSEGVYLQAQDGMQVSFILSPGHYEAKAEIGSQKLNANFDLDQGQVRNIELGN